MGRGSLCRADLEQPTLENQLPCLKRASRKWTAFPRSSAKSSCADCERRADRGAVSVIGTPGPEFDLESASGLPATARCGAGPSVRRRGERPL